MTATEPRHTPKRDTQAAEIKRFRARMAALERALEAVSPMAHLVVSFTPDLDTNPGSPAPRGTK